MGAYAGSRFLLKPRRPIAQRMRATTFPITPPDLDGGTDLLTVTASSELDAGGRFVPVGPTPNSGWLPSNGAMPNWWQVQLKTARVVTGYSLTGSEYDANRDPRDWTFQGSNDGSSWTTLDTQASITGWSLNQVRSFTFANSTAYSYYRLNITANNGSSYTSVNGVTFVGARLRSSLAAWYKADSLALSDGDPLSAWTDSSAHENNLSGISGTAPVYRMAGPNGMPCVDHTAAIGGMYVNNTNDAPTSEATFFAVVWENTTTGGPIINSNPHHLAFEIYPGRTVGIDKPGDATMFVGSTTFPAATWTIILATFKSGVGGWVDVSGVTESIGYGGISFARDQMAYGTNLGYGNRWDGKTAEVGVYDRVLSSDDLVLLKAYLTAKYVAPPPLGSAIPSRPATMRRAFAAQQASRW